jgi:hypothetical protein
LITYEIEDDTDEVSETDDDDELDDQIAED